MTIVRWFVGSRLSRIYLAVVAAALAWNWWEHLAWAERKPSVSGTYPTLADGPPLLLTAPTSPALVHWSPAAWDGQWLFTAFVLVGALVNAAALNGIRRLAHRRRTPGGPGTADLRGRARPDPNP